MVRLVTCLPPPFGKKDPSLIQHFKSSFKHPKGKLAIPHAILCFLHIQCNVFCCALILPVGSFLMGKSCAFTIWHVFLIFTLGACGCFIGNIMFTRSFEILVSSSILLLFRNTIGHIQQSDLFLTFCSYVFVLLVSRQNKALNSTHVFVTQKS